MSTRRWGRVNEEGFIVEFTYEDPTGRFHPDLIWVEVDKDTKPYTRITIIGSTEEYNPEAVVGFNDEEALYKQAVANYEANMNKAESAPKKRELNDFTINDMRLIED